MMQPESQKLVKELSNLSGLQFADTEGRVLVDAIHHITMLEQQLAKARKDTEMLDLIDKKLRDEWEIFNSETAWFVGCYAADTLRQAITLAMKKGKSE